MIEPREAETDYRPQDYRNWKLQEWGDTKGQWHREEEGRSTIWNAQVIPHEGKWWALIYRTTGSGKRRGWFQAIAYADGQWKIGSFTTPGRAIAFAERWLEVRCDRATWRSSDPPIMAGDRYTIWVIEEEKALEWPNRRDGIECRR